VFQINGFLWGVWRLKLCNEDRQQAPSHLLFARPRAKLKVTMKYDFKRYDASIKVIPCHSLYLWIFHCLPCHLGRLKNGTALTPSHHYPTMKHTWSFYNLCNWKHSSYFSSNGTLELLKWCICPYQRLLNLPFFHPASKKAYAEIWVGMRVRHTCITCIAKPNNGSMEKYVILLDQDVHVCGYVVDIWCLS
jgi:hypothetical protein